MKLLIFLRFQKRQFASGLIPIMYFKEPRHKYKKDTQGNGIKKSILMRIDMNYAKSKYPF